MSLETITIVRQCPIINSFVQLENNNPSNKTSVPVDAFIAATGGIVNRLPHVNGMGRNGGRYGSQEWVEFSENYTCCGYNTTLEAGKTTFETNKQTDKAIWD